jgi:hypothetical protein
MKKMCYRIFNNSNYIQNEPTFLEICTGLFVLKSYEQFVLGNLTRDTILGKFCGLIRPTAVYRSSSTQMLIVFSSDYAIQKAGFRIRIKAVDNSKCNS